MINWLDTRPRKETSPSTRQNAEPKSRRLLRISSPLAYVTRSAKAPCSKPSRLAPEPSNKSANGPA